jgi:hypothetical protein
MKTVEKDKFNKQEKESLGGNKECNSMCQNKEEGIFLLIFIKLNSFSFFRCPNA